MAFFNKDPMLASNIILEHYDNPTHKIEENNIPEGYITYHNKSNTCIDDITVYLKIENKIIKDALFSGIGCAISTSTTDIFCDLLINKTLDEANILLDNYQKMISNEKYDEDILDELLVFYNIPNQPNRIKCSKMGYFAINEILNEELKK